MFCFEYDGCMPFFSRGLDFELKAPKQEKDPLSEQPVLGKDSLGNALHRGQLIIKQDLTGDVSLTGLTSKQTLRSSEKIIGVPQHQPLESSLQRIRVEVLPEKNWIDIDTLASLPPEHWSQIQTLVNAYDALCMGYGNREGKTREELLSSLRSIALEIQPGEFLLKFIQGPNTLELHTYTLKNDSPSYTFSHPPGHPPTQEKIGNVWYSLQEIQDHDYLVPATASLPPELPAAQALELERNHTPQQIVERLQQDFPWFEMSDLRSSHLPQAHATSPFDHVAEADINRLAKLYPDSDSDEYGEAFTQPNDSEMTYLASRNYARLVEFAVMTWQSSQLETFGRPDMTQVDAALRERISSEFIAQVEQRLFRLNNTRRLLELQLFGDDFPDTTNAFLDRFASGDTLETHAYGVYTRGLTNLITLSTQDRSMYRHIMRLPPDERPRAFLDQVADIMSHENGHLKRFDRDHYGKSNKRVPVELAEDTIMWSREEIWNEWRTVILPHQLLQEAPAFSSQYLLDPSTHKRGGAWKIQDMISELMDNAAHAKIMIPLYNQEGEEIGAEPLTSDLIMKSALATALKRSEFTPITVAGHTLPGFAMLYDEVFGKNAFFRQVDGLADTNYNDPSTDARPGKKSPRPLHQTEDLETILSQYIAQQVTRQLTEL